MNKPENISEVMRWIGSHTSEKKAKSSRINGSKGGRPINPESKRQRKLREKE